MANLIYHQPETALTWKSSSQSPSGGDFTCASLGSSAGRNGERLDKGALTAKASLYRWTMHTRFATAPVVGEQVEGYIKTWNEGSTYGDNDDGTTDGALSAEDKLRNLLYIGSIVVDQASTGVIFVASGLVEIRSRYFAPVWYNRTADALSGVDADHGFILEPVPEEIQ